MTAARLAMVPLSSSINLHTDHFGADSVSPMMAVPCTLPGDRGVRPTVTVTMAPVRMMTTGTHHSREKLANHVPGDIWCNCRVIKAHTTHHTTFRAASHNVKVDVSRVTIDTPLVTHATTMTPPTAM